MSDTASDLSGRLAAVVEKAAPSVVRVEGRRRAASSGVVFGADMVLTAHHCLEWDEGIRVGLGDGSLLSAALVGRTSRCCASPAPVSPRRAGRRRTSRWAGW